MPSKNSTRPVVGSRLTFGNDWNVTQSGPLIAGQPIEIQYAAERLHAVARGPADADERKCWTITGYFSVDGVPAKTFAAASQSITGAVLIAPEVGKLGPGSLELWFEVNDIYGENHYDSDYGRNYHFKIYPSVLLSQTGAVNYVGSLAA